MKFLKVSCLIWGACKSPFMTLWKLDFVRINLVQPNFPETIDKSLACTVSTKFVKC
jgi:hypothetical protein